METAQLQELEAPQASPGSAAKLIREVKRKARKRFSSEDKIRIVLEGFRSRQGKRMIKECNAKIERLIDLGLPCNDWLFWQDSNQKN